MLLDPADKGRLTDIFQYGNRALKHLGSLTFDEFIADTKTYDSVIRCLAVLGEAAWKLTKDFQNAYPATPWILISTMRHRLVHEYGSIDNEIIYKVLSNHLPTLIKNVTEILEKESV